MHRRRKRGTDCSKMSKVIPIAIGFEQSLFERDSGVDSSQHPTLLESTGRPSVLLASEHQETTVESR